MDNDVHARFQRMLLGEPEPEPAAQPVPQLASPPQPEALPPAQSQPSQRLPQQQQQHVDVNVNVKVVTPPPAPTPRAPATTIRHLTAQPPSMVSIIQDQWLHLCDYFQRVQCANSAAERASLVRELGVVEDSLSTILDALLTDRKQLVSTQLLHTHMSIFGDSSHSDHAGLHEGLSGVSGGGLRGTSASPVPSPATGFLIDGALTALPPCYRYLFADAHRDDLPSEKEESDEEVNARPGVGAAAKAALKAYGEPSPIGGLFLLTLCQYAKQDEPPGVRSIILEFLVRLLQEADLPTDRAAYPAGDPVLSLLQLNPSLLIVPLLDMLRKVSKSLDPSNTALRHGSVAASGSVAYPWSGGAHGDSEDGTFLQDAGRTQFVIFLSSLAEKMERVPALANFFVVEDGAQGERSLFVLLDALLPYLTHDCSAPGWTHRRDTCRYALSAVVSLAKCPDPWIQELVGKEERVATRTLMAARTTLVTLCKIPDNDDSATQLLFLRDVLRFWATLLTMSPSVATDLRLAVLIEKEFHFQTLIPLLQSSDTHVYSAACLVTAQLLQELNGGAPILSRGLAKALLATSIRKSSGRTVPNTEHYESVVASDGGPGKTDATATNTSNSAAAATMRTMTLGQQEEAAAVRLHLHPTTSFFLYYIVPHLSSNPYISPVEKENSAMLGYATTRWSTVKATLVLVQSLAENVPEVFLREVFLMDMGSLADVLRKQQQNAAARTTAATTTMMSGSAAAGATELEESRIASLGLWSTEMAPPHLKVRDYFVKELHETAATSAALGLQAERVGEVVLTRLLRTEGNMSTGALRCRQKVMSAMTQTNACGVASAEFGPPPASAASQSGSCWSHTGVQRSPLTAALCEMVQHLDATPFTVSSLVADLIVSLCVLPDLRVLYTLLDPKTGPLKVALSQLRDVLQHRINAKGVEVQLAAPATTRTGVNATSSASSAAAATKTATTRVSLVILYDTLLRHWDSFMGDEKGEESKEEEGEGGDAHIGQHGGGVPLSVLRGAIEANSNVLHACLYSEYLLAHLDAAIGYSALSQNLMYLRTNA